MSSKDCQQMKKVIRSVLHLLPIKDSLKGKWRVYRIVDRILFSANDIRKCETNDCIIPKLLASKKHKYPKEYAKIERSALKFMAESTIDEDSDKVRQDMMYWYFAYGYTPAEYICYGFEKLNPEERKKFVSDRESVKYAYRLNKWDDMDLFMNKFRTYERFKKYYKRKIVNIKNERDYYEYCQFVNENRKFVKKNANESCGRGVELIEVQSVSEASDKLFKQILEEVKSTGACVVLEELVHQSIDMEKFNSSSVNTVRCITLKTGEGVITPFCFMKIGRNGSFIDNGGAGGLLIGIDETSGILNTDAIDESGNRYNEHPDTGISFKGSQLPDWSQMRSICIEMANVIDTIKWIGWDMAHTDKGWVVIEGNAVTEVIGPQATSGIGIRMRLDHYLMSTEMLF